jgi:hypothetical protein
MDGGWFFPPGWKPRLYGRQDACRYTGGRAPRVAGGKDLTKGSLGWTNGRINDATRGGVRHLCLT